MFWNKAKRVKSTRELTHIRSEADIDAFRRTDPFCLPSNLHGDARFAWLQHFWRAGMFDTETEWHEQRRGYPLAAIHFDHSDTPVVSGFLKWPHEGNRLIVGSPGTGKLTSAIAPLLLDDDGSNAFIIDPKGGEACRYTARYRSHIARNANLPGAVMIDPCSVFPAYTSESLNPLDTIRRDNPNVVGDVDKLVDALVIVSGHERDPFWGAMAKKILRALVLHVATAPESASPTLMDVQRIVSDGVDADVILAMAANPVADGLVMRAAVEIDKLKEATNTWLGVKGQIDASLTFLDNLGVRRTLASTSFDVRALRRERLALYVVLPNKEKDALSRWLRLIYTTVIDQIDDVPGRDVHVVVDEFAALGKFDRVLTDLATQRSAGMRYHLAVQDLNQLNELYGHGWQTIIGNCSVRQFLGVNDNFTAEYVSHALGRTTLQDGEDVQHDYPDAPPKRRPRFVGRELMTPAEILAMPREDMLVFADRCARPIRVPKSPYYETELWADRAQKLR